MWDKSEIRIPLSPVYVRGQRETANGLTGVVSAADYDFPEGASRIYRENGLIRAEGLHTPWDSIPTSFSSMAAKFFPMGNGFYEWPHVVIKASPAKILQGHNVYGSENIRPGIEEMLGLLLYSFPKLFDHLDIDNAEVRWLDCTYSAKLESDFYIKRLLDFIATQSSRKVCVDNKYEGTVYLSKASEYMSQKIYNKLKELLEDIKEEKKKRHSERLPILQKQLDFALHRIRFEASIKHRRLLDLGIPTRLPEFFKFCTWFETVHKEPLCRYFWRLAFSNLFDDLEGHTMKNVDDSHIQTKIFAKLNYIDAKGRVNQRKSNAVWNTYLQIRPLGYQALSENNNQTFFRNVNLLIDCGLSRGFLRSLDPMRPHDNVFPLVKLINVDFGAQRPADWVEPISSFRTESPRLRRVC